MFLIVGLGNIGKEYDNTRHNIGFSTLDIISKEYNIPLKGKKFKGDSGEGLIGGEKVLLLKPSTYMNLSGESVAAAASFYKISSNNIIVICDDINLSVGTLRIREKGSAGGHNGLKNIISCLNTEDFIRIRIGVSKPKEDLVSHVLGRFSKEELQEVTMVSEKASEAAVCIIQEGIAQSMNKYNGVLNG